MLESYALLGAAGRAGVRKDKKFFIMVRVEQCFSVLLQDFISSVASKSTGPRPLFSVPRWGARMVGGGFARGREFGVRFPLTGIPGRLHEGDVRGWAMMVHPSQFGCLFLSRLNLERGGHSEAGYCLIFKGTCGSCACLMVRGRCRRKQNQNLSAGGKKARGGRIRVNRRGWKEKGRRRGGRWRWFECRLQMRRGSRPG